MSATRPGLGPRGLSMKTGDVIARLSSELSPIKPHAMRRRIALGVGAGSLAASALLLLSLGVRADLSQAIGTLQFWLKWLFTAALSLAAFGIAERLGRPAGIVGRAWWGLVLPVLAAAILAAAETLRSPPGNRAAIWLGHTALQCPIAILALAAPVYVGIVWAYRRFAPTRLRLAGGAAGVLAAGIGASVYVLACPESTAAFMVAWYTAALAVAAALGVAAGPRVLRW